MPTAKRLVVSLFQTVWFGLPCNESSIGRPVFSANRGNALLTELLEADSPFMVSRLGTQEAGCVAYYLRWRLGHHLKFPYPNPVKRSISFNAGVFSNDDESLDRFSRIYLDAVSTADMMGVWFADHGAIGGQCRVIRDYGTHAQLVDVDAYMSMLYDEPWSSRLKGKRVLVIHPFAATIESQYRNVRHLLFSDPRVLPEFELITLPAPQSAAGSHCSHASWFDALATTCEQITQIPYDVALIGAGAYGLPLAAFVKEQGKQAIHIGGATQLFFGIRGKRWDSHELLQPLMNSHWARPSAEETPAGAKFVENGCYW